MKTFIDPKEFCAAVMERATEQGWTLEIGQLNVAMRYRWQWSWKTVHSMPERESMFPSLEEAKFAACLELVTAAEWNMRLEVSVPMPMELEQVTSMRRAVS